MQTTYKAFSPARRILTAAVLLLVGLLPALAADTPATQPGRTLRFFWKITSPTTTVYFLGSIHAADKTFYPLPPEIEAAFKNSDLLVVEVDMTKVNTTELALKMLKDASYPPGDSLDKHLAPETMKQVKAFCDAGGLPIAFFSSMKPAMVGVTIEGIKMQQLGLSPELGIDEHFLGEATAATPPTPPKTIVGLETADDQIKMITDLDDKQSNAWLIGSLKDLDKESLDQLMTIWKQGDTQAALELLTKDEKDSPENLAVNEHLIYSRNDAMTAKIEQLLKGDKPAFVVVGAAHLLGDRGILKQLEQKQFKLERPALTAAAATQP